MSSDDASVVDTGEKLSWAPNSLAVRAQTLVSHGAWAGAAQQEILQFGVKAPLRTSAEAGEAYLAAAVVVMLKKTEATTNDVTSNHSLRITAEYADRPKWGLRPLPDESYIGLAALDNRQSSYRDELESKMSKVFITACASSAVTPK